MIRLLSTPYEENGRDLETGLDCLGLVLWIYRHVWGMDLPDPLEQPAATNLLFQMFQRVSRGEEVRIGDVLQMPQCHLGLVVTPAGDVIHSRIGIGVSLIRLSTALRGATVFRLKGGSGGP